MARFYPLYVRRSDGKSEVLNSKRKKEANQPTPEQLDQKPDKNGVSDYYREVGIEETKHLDWRRKLGGMLAREFGYSDAGMSIAAQSQRHANEPREIGYMLVAFPEHYRLYEHVKKSEGGDGKTVKTTKTHAGGGNDRQDAYLYGHPMGRKKRFRSPVEFYPHLLWLVTDEAGDPDNCACRICCPEELEEKTAPVPKKEVKSEPVMKKDEVKPPTMARQPVVEITRPTSTQDPKQMDSPSALPLHPAQRVSTPQQTPSGTPQPQVASPLPKQTKVDQQIDLRYDMFMYRQGELVWYQKSTEAWGLGIILRRWKKDMTPVYHIQPLSHPYDPAQSHSVSANESIRPWLAWSVPQFFCPELRAQPAWYDSVDWRTLVHRYSGSPEMVANDAAILAAKKMDATYTPFDLIVRVQPQQGIEEICWTGIYLGAEKLWIGDVARLRTETSNVVFLLVLHAIVERTEVSSFNGVPTRRILHLAGDVYASQEAPYNNINEPLPKIPGLDRVPQRMLEDIRRRNEFTIRARQAASYWKLVRAGARYEIKDIRGRWYEPTLIFPVMEGADNYTAHAQKGEFREYATLLNSRGDCHGQSGVPAPLPDKRTPERRDAAGTAVSTFKLVEGMSPPSATEQQQRQAQQQPQTQHQQQAQTQPQPPSSMMGQDPHMALEAGFGNGVDDGALRVDDFMNLDDEMPEFGQQYNSQGNHGQPYY